MMDSSMHFPSSPENLPVQGYDQSSSPPLSQSPIMDRLSHPQPLPLSERMKTEQSFEAASPETTVLESLSQNIAAGVRSFIGPLNKEAFSKDNPVGWNFSLVAAGASLGSASIKSFSVAAKALTDGAVVTALIGGSVATLTTTVVIGSIKSTMEENTRSPSTIETDHQANAYRKQALEDAGLSKLLHKAS